LNLVGTASINLPNQSLTLVNVPVTGTVSAGMWLVAEVDSPDGNGVSGLWVGSNNLGQSDPSYISSTVCGLTNPTDLAAIGQSQMMVVINVYGDEVVGGESCDAPQNIP
jgi:hypothetical protein